MTRTQAVVTPKRPPLRDMDEALKLVRREAERCRDVAESHRERATAARTPEIAECLVKMAGQTERRGERLMRVLAWMGDLCDGR